jgi:hypothetical protein
LRPQIIIFLRAAKKVHDLLQVGFGFVSPDHIFKSNRGLVAGVTTSFAATKAKDAAGLILSSAATHPPEQADHQQKRQPL